MPPDALDRLLDTRADRQPRLVWYSPSERIELSGHVLSMWQAKAAGLITAESEPEAAVHLGCPTHWRTIAWACGAWLAGRRVVMPGTGAALTSAAPGPSGPLAVGSAASARIGMSVAFEERRLDPGAEVHVLVPEQSLAVRWPGRLPPLVIDGAAELMTHPDAFTAVPAPGRAPGLTLLAGPGAGGPTTLTRDQLAGPEAAAAGTGGAASSDADPPRPSPTARLVRAEDPGRALLEVLGAWSRGATAVLLAPGADDALAAAAARQEGAHGAPAHRGDERRS